MCETRTQAEGAATLLAERANDSQGGGNGPPSTTSVEPSEVGVSPQFPSRDSHWGYVSYKHMHELFRGHQDLLEAVRWADFGLGIDGSVSTFWFGSAEAHTACHYDTYGSNLVAQLYGRKRWTLFPPKCTPSLYPTRIPYEESSVFSQVDVSHPDLAAHPLYADAVADAVEITLEPGDVLFVPRHWWHFVHSPETAISVNTWLPAHEDPAERLREGLVRWLVCGLLRDSGQVEAHLNPGEVSSLFGSPLPPHTQRPCVCEHGSHIPSPPPLFSWVPQLEVVAANGQCRNA